jgi:hypothetical protein
MTRTFDVDISAEGEIEANRHIANFQHEINELEEKLNRARMNLEYWQTALDRIYAIRYRFEKGDYDE